MYTQKQIDNDRKHYLKEQKEISFKLLEDTQGTQLCWEVSCFYDQDKWNKGVMTVHATEEEAINNVKESKKDGYDLFYRPIVIDDDSGETGNFKNLHYYKKGSYFVKSLNKYLYS
jgi:hypothetical protein